MMMDLERFKAVNDRFGHQNGDLVLLAAANLLRAQLRNSDICLRYGGDEFLAILPGVDEQLALQTRRRIQTVFDEKPVADIENEPVQVGVSIGVAGYPKDALEVDTLVAFADREMYFDKTKRAGDLEGRVGSVVKIRNRRDQR